MRSIEEGRNEDEADDDKITINDNRISIYSRGKLGEYDILSKIKNNRNSEAYVIGELFVDIFEQDNLADMAISNRRGYEKMIHDMLKLLELPNAYWDILLIKKIKLVNVEKKIMMKLKVRK